MSFEDILELDDFDIESIVELEDDSDFKKLVIVCDSIMTGSDDNSLFTVKAYDKDCFDKKIILTDDNGETPIESYNHILSKGRRNKRKNF